MVVQTHNILQSLRANFCCYQNTQYMQTRRGSFPSSKFTCTWYYMLYVVAHGTTWFYVVLNGTTWLCVVVHGIKLFSVESTPNTTHMLFTHMNQLASDQTQLSLLCSLSSCLLLLSSSVVIQLGSLEGHAPHHVHVH